MVSADSPGQLAVLSQEVISNTVQGLLSVEELIKGHDRETAILGLLGTLHPETISPFLSLWDDYNRSCLLAVSCRSNHGCLFVSLSPWHFEIFKVGVAA